MIPLILVLTLTGAALLAFFAGEEQRNRGWRRCVACRCWFDRQGAATNSPPLIARFAIHGDGACPRCTRLWEESMRPPCRGGE